MPDFLQQLIVILLPAALGIVEYYLAQKNWVLGMLLPLMAVIAALFISPVYIAAAILFLLILLITRVVATRKASRGK